MLESDQQTQNQQPSDAPNNKPNEAPNDASSDAPSNKPNEAPNNVSSDAPSNKPNEAPNDVSSDVISDVEKEAQMIKKVKRQYRYKRWSLAGIWHRFRYQISNLIESFDRDRILFRQTDSVQKNHSDSQITVILNLYNREKYLPALIKSIRKQSVAPAQIWLWVNKGNKNTLDFSDLVDRVVVSNHNWKFFGRFSLAMMVTTKYVAFFDDDMLPGANWFENCLQSMHKLGNVILGGSGVILPVGGGYDTRYKVGWNGLHLDYPAEVDLVGHAWFLESSTLKYIWQERPHTLENGEDIHLSYTSLKLGEIKTFVPPHKPEMKKSWSSQPVHGKVSGAGPTASYRKHGNAHQKMRDEIVDTYRTNGWKIMTERTGLTWQSHYFKAFPDEQ